MNAEGVMWLGLIAASLFSIPWVLAVRRWRYAAVRDLSTGAVLITVGILGIPWWLAWSMAGVLLGLSIRAWVRVRVVRP